MDYQRIDHPIMPVFDENSKILILGSFPSVKSREECFFYGHPQNRFWRVISTIFNYEYPNTTDDKRKLLLDNNIAVWDVIKSCDIIGSSDSSIKNVVPNDISFILSNSQINAIYTNGKKADKLYNQYIEDKVGIKAICLPSTSPANAMWSLEKLIEYWGREISNI